MRFVLLALALTATQAASATTVRGFGTRDMVREAAVVVRGTVTQQGGVYSADRSKIYTESRVQLREVVVGRVPTAEIVVRQLGGTVGQVSMVVSGVARIQPGEDVLLFLRTDGERYYLVGMAQGKYTVRVQRGREVVSRALHGLNLIQGARPVGAGPPRAAPSERVRDYHAFVATLRRYARELGR